jgi:hypothetical protein
VKIFCHLEYSSTKYSVTWNIPVRNIPSVGIFQYKKIQPVGIFQHEIFSQMGGRKREDDMWSLRERRHGGKKKPQDYSSTK